MSESSKTITTIRISQDNHAWLKGLGKKDESYNDILDRIKSASASNKETIRQ